MKKWTGKELYDVYRNKLLAAFNCGTDSWEELSEEDQAVWDMLAEEVSAEETT